MVAGFRLPTERRNDISSHTEELKNLLERTRKRWPTNAELAELRHGLETAIALLEQTENPASSR